MLTDGEWVWDEAANDFDWGASTAVPAVLAGVFGGEPRHSDLLGLVHEQLNLRNGRFRDQIADLVAPIHGVAKDELAGADVREHRRTIRTARIGVSALVVLVVLCLLGATLAVRNATRADENAARADQQRRLSDAERLAVQSTALVETQPDLAALLSRPTGVPHARDGERVDGRHLSTPATAARPDGEQPRQRDRVDGRRPAPRHGPGTATAGSADVALHNS